MIADMVADMVADMSSAISTGVLRKLATLLLLIIALPALGEPVRWKGYDIYYTTFRSTLVPADVAALHNITRGDRRILTNITVRKNGEPVRASVSGRVTNLLSQLETLEFKEVVEEAAIYYLANQLVDERDTLRYTIDIRPDTEEESFRLEFARQYYGGGGQ